MKNKIDILGTEYKIEYRSFKKDKKLDEADGYTDFFFKLIVIEDDFENRNMISDKIKKYQEKILRHEVIHAFLYESGLDCNSNKTISWADNEEMVDWIAIQFPKILEVYKKLQIL